MDATNNTETRSNTMKTADLNAAREMYRTLIGRAARELGWTPAKLRTEAEILRPAWVRPGKADCMVWLDAATEAFDVACESRDA